MPTFREDDVGRCLSLLEARAPRPFTVQEMAARLGLHRYDRGRLERALDAHVRSGRLRRIGKRRYQWKRERERGERPRERGEPRREGEHARAPRPGGRRVTGRYSRAAAGFGFVEVLGEEARHFPRDIFIARGREGAAMHGDHVEVEIGRRDRRGERTAGRVVAVTAQRNERLVGRIERVPDGWIVIPASELLPPVRLAGTPLPLPEDAGRAAVVRITRPPSPGRWPEGALERVLGGMEDPDVQVLAIAYEHGLRMEFPPDAEAEAARLPLDPSEADWAGRLDLRALPFVTIDGETARDFDDAVCLEERSGGTRLWVAIADVSHYVTPGSALDLEAARRGTSVYFPDRAVPMLPPRLSTELCSLNPGRPRLVLTAALDYDRRGRRTRAAFERAVITSQARLTYTEVAAVLAGGSARAEIRPLVPQLERMHALMRTLGRRRFAAGSLDLDLPEALVDLSEEGRSIGLRLFERNDAHRLIEEFMLEANRAVAESLTERGVPLPYRIHEPPAPADVDELNRLLAEFGLSLDYRREVEPADVQRLLRRLVGHPLARVLARQVLRSLKQARYATENAGHFGLAFSVYCHFTSPIRRYPDLLVHRQLGRVLDERLREARADSARLAAASIESSRLERLAIDAERAMLDLKKAEFMLHHLHEPAPATVVSVVRSGAFVELDAWPIEGLVRQDEGSRRPFRLGERLVVEATAASLERRQIDFQLVRRLGEASGPGIRKAPRPTRNASASKRRGKTRR
ncbi:MAG TPA: VacB/RNase II family 3'-5' exoribonuclease [Candidatus Limnocylindria bacterium]|nr:VacB/RNase II family 3'-5' exoribonuclease [Candidatus Limnocylindria bacterium]